MEPEFRQFRVSGVARSHCTAHIHHTAYLSLAVGRGNEDEIVGATGTSRLRRRARREMCTAPLVPDKTSCPRQQSLDPRNLLGLSKGEPPAAEALKIILSSILGDEEATSRRYNHLARRKAKYSTTQIATIRTSA